MPVISHYPSKLNKTNKVLPPRIKFGIKCMSGYLLYMLFRNVLLQHKKTENNNEKIRDKIDFNEIVDYVEKNRRHHNRKIKHKKKENKPNQDNEKTWEQWFKILQEIQNNNKNLDKDDETSDSCDDNKDKSNKEAKKTYSDNDSSTDSDDDLVNNSGNNSGDCGCGNGNNSGNNSGNDCENGNNNSGGNSGNGNGSGNGSGDGSGNGSGDGSGNGSGDGSGNGSGNGSGDGSGTGSGGNPSTAPDNVGTLQIFGDIQSAPNTCTVFSTQRDPSTKTPLISMSTISLSDYNLLIELFTSDSYPNYTEQGLMILNVLLVDASKIISNDKPIYIFRTLDTFNGIDTKISDIFSLNNIGPNTNDPTIIYQSILYDIQIIDNSNNNNIFSLYYGKNKITNKVEAHINIYDTFIRLTPKTNGCSVKFTIDCSTGDIIIYFPQEKLASISNENYPNSFLLCENHDNKQFDLNLCPVVISRNGDVQETQLISLRL